MRYRRPSTWVLLLVAAALAWLFWPHLVPRNASSPSGVPGSRDVGHQEEPRLGGLATDTQDDTRVQSVPAAPIPSPGGPDPGPHLGAWRVTGSVVDARGGSVSGADVTLSLRRGPVLIACQHAVTDEDGSYEASLRLPEIRSPALDATTKLVVTAIARGYSGDGTAERVSVPPGPDPASTLPDLELAPGCVVYGRVVTVAGSPVPSAEVTLVGVNGPDKSRPITNAVTDAEGQFVISWSPFETVRICWLWVTSPRHGTGHGDRFELDGAAAHESEDIVLGRGAGPALGGIVHLPGGQPAPGVQVWAQPLDAEVDAMIHDPWTGAEVAERSEPCAVTSLDGRFRLHVPRPGRYRLATLPLELARPRVARAGDEDLALEVTGHLLRVEVLDADGHRLTGAIVVVRTWGGVDEADVRQQLASSGSDGPVSPPGRSWHFPPERDGRWVVPLDPATLCLVEASAPDFGKVERLLTLPPGSGTTEVQLTLETH